MKRVLSTCIVCLLAVALHAQQRYTLTLKTLPQGLATFNVNASESLPFGGEKGSVQQIIGGDRVFITIHDMPNGWKVTEWRATEGYANVGLDANGNTNSFVMPSENLTLTAVMSYNPDNPDNPMPNGWYPDEGKLVIDYTMNSGYNDYVATLISDPEDCAMVKTMVVGGYVPGADQMVNFEFTAEKYPSLHTVDLSRTNGFTTFYAQDRPWRELLLPASIEEIGNEAFKGTFIEKLTIFASTPPKLHMDYHFNEQNEWVPYRQNSFPTASDMTVFVPAEALALYQAAPGWNEFQLRPIIDQAANITVNVLPEGTVEDLIPYYGMTLELRNIKSLETRRLIISNRQSYIFYTLPTNTSYDVRLLNRAGSVIAHRENIVLKEENVSIGLSDLRQICALIVRVMKDGSYVKDDAYSIVWTDKYDNVIGHNPNIDGIVGDEPVKMIFSLADNEMKKSCRNRDTIVINNPAEVAVPQHITYNIKALPLYRLGTIVERADGKYIDRHEVHQRVYQVTNDGNILVSDDTFSSPTLQGAYPYQGLTMDTPLTLPEGDYEVTVQTDDRNLTTGSLKVSLRTDQTVKFALMEAKGSVINATWTHYGVVDEGVDISQARRTDKRIDEATLTIRDLTNGVELKDYAARNDNTICLVQRLEPGTEIEVTLGNGDDREFAPAVKRGKADAEGNVKLDFETYDYGTLVVGFDASECSSVAIKVFDSNGKLADSYEGSARQVNKTSFTSLKDGSYTVVLMEGGDIANAMNTLGDIRKFLDLDIHYSTDYANITSGHIERLTVESVPALPDEVHLYTDNHNTRITPKRASLPQGVVQTMSAQVDFMPEYKGRVSQLKAIFTIPENEDMHFLEGSVIINNDKAPYTRHDEQLEIPLVEGRLLRFCVVPTGTGRATIPGRIAFMLDGEEYEQPLPTTPFDVTGCKLRVIEETNREIAPVVGTALPNTEVTLIVNGNVVGATTSDNEGEWRIDCPINNSYNMCINTIYAQYKGAGGFVVKTPEKRVIFDRYGIRVKNVNMSWSSIEERIFKKQLLWYNFELNDFSPKTYSVRNGGGEVHYDIELATSDTTYIDDVLVYVETNNGNQYELHAKYNYGAHWHAFQILNDNEGFPTSVGAEVIHHAPKMLGYEGISGRVHYWDDFYKESRQRRNTVQQMGDALMSTTEGSVEEEEAFYNLMKYVDIAQEGYLQAYEQNKDKPGFDPEHPDPSNPYFPGYTESYYPDGDAALVEIAADIEEGEQEIEALTKTYNLDGPGWELGELKQLNELGEVIPGFTVSRVSDATRQYYESRRGHLPTASGAAAAENNVFEYEVTCEGGNSVFLRMDDNGYRLVMLDEDIQYDVDFSAINPQMGAAVRQLFQVRSEMENLSSMAPLYSTDSFINYMNSLMDSLLDAMAKLSNTLGAWQSWMEESAQLCEKAYRDTKAAGWKMWRRHRDLVSRGFGNTVQGKKHLLKCKIGGFFTAQKLDRLRELKQMFEEMRGSKALGPIFGVLNLYSDYNDLIDALANIIELYGSIPDPCPDDQAAANSIRRQIVGWGTLRLGQKALAVKSDILSLTAAIVGLISTPVTSGGGPVLGGAVSLGLSIGTWLGNLAFDWAYKDFFDNMRTKINKLDCSKDKTNKTKNNHTKIGPIIPLIDPSGYVYEAVASNRVKDAMASIYFKDIYEDIYGDEHERVTLWDAEKYGYVNPQLTDEEGKYGWDVPAGQWQVRVIKDGYVMTQSEWLPVPPPQLDVNLELQQPTAPVVERVTASENGVELRFDKYMKPAHLTNENIFLTRNGKILDGTIRLTDEEPSPNTANTYARTVLFIPEQPLKLNEKVRLTVKSGVESYANVGMQHDFTQEFDVEQHVMQIMADSIVGLLHGEQYNIIVSAVPAQASVGKKVLVNSLNPDVVSTEATELTLDQEGRAVLTIKGIGYGTTTVHLTLADNHDVQALAAVSVLDSESLITPMPNASRISGTEVAFGSTVRLSCQTPGAVIYYTIDGSCPCDNPDRLRYNSPISILSDMTLKAIASAPGYAESEVATFTYKVKRAPEGIDDSRIDDSGLGSTIYDLQGRQIAKSRNSKMERGIYIQKGKKIVVR